MSALSPTLDTVSNDTRLAAVRARDANCDGQFVYGVRSTCIYCKPSCKSRPARTENIEFFVSSKEAERAGFRACKRCKPERDGQPPERVTLVTQLCRWIETSDTAPSLADLAQHSGLSASRLHRLFKATTGVTPKAYVDAQRQKRLHAELHTNTTVTRAIYASGFNSSGRFYEHTDELLGMTPAAYKRGGEGQVIRFAIGECSLGAILVAASDRGVCWVALGNDAVQLVEEVQRQFPKAEFLGNEPHFDTTVAKVVSLVEDPKTPFDLPLDIRGTAFQCRVWAALREIPVGKTLSYAELATKLGSPKAVRAVAQACATNAVAVVIPCHRVVRVPDGGLAGYRWGIERKRALLQNEGLDYSSITTSR